MFVQKVGGSPLNERGGQLSTNEQVYVIVRGRGLMRVADEEQPVEAGDLVFIPPKAGHAIRNVGDEPLIYVSASSPPFDRDALEWPFRYV